MEGQPFHTFISFLNPRSGYYTDDQFYFLVNFFNIFDFTSD